MSKKNTKKVLWENDYFKVVEVISSEGGLMTGLELEDNVVVLPYTMENGVLKEIGMMWEHNPLREGNFWDTAITGNVEDDESALDAAKRETKEESGYDIQEDDRWLYLGKLVTSKLVDLEHECYCVDITDLEIGGKVGDGTENEKLSKFKLVPVSDILKTKDAFLLSLLLKFFFKKFKNVFENPTVEK